MKKFYLLVMPLLLLVFIAACTKEEIIATDYIGETSLHSDDQARFSTEMDAVARDVNAALEMTPGFTGRNQQFTASFCDATVVADTLSNPRTITITYNGANCYSTKNRTGKIIIKMDAATRWQNAGATLDVNFVNLSVNRFKDDKDITINGSQLYTNVSGGLLADLASMSNVTHTIWSDDMDVLFDNGKEWSWKTARKKVYKNTNSGIVVTTTGTHAMGGIGGIAEWGNNRFGHPFSTPILIPLVSRQDCNYRVVSGKIEVILTDLVYATGTLGLNESGNPIGCPGSNSYWLEVIWMGPSGTRRTLRLPY